ncbi:MAG: hypothetical protein CMK56_01005 [Proteobacteria bacterium]|nr:hypothetical protein [Pseudomonadota bacterium]
MQKLALDDSGVIIIPKFVPNPLIERLKTDLDLAYECCRQAQSLNNLEAKQDASVGSLKGVAHHVLSQGKSFLDLLELRPGLDLIEQYLNSKLIIYNYGAFINEGNGDLYKHGMSIHRDTRTPEFGKHTVVVMVNLDNFTETNGATYLLPGSHQNLQRPDTEHFLKYSHQAIVDPGALVIFDARVWHAAGRNTDGTKRRALTISFTRPCFKPQFDYCRALGTDKIESMSETIQQLVGYRSRIPSTLEEWYRPLPDWYYQRGQDSQIV